MLKIDGPHNDTYKKLLSLTASKGLKQEGLFLLSGEKLVREFLRQPNLAIDYVLTTATMPELDMPDQTSALQRLELAAPLFTTLDVLGTRFPLLVLHQPAVTSLTMDHLAAYQPQGMEVVIPVGDPGNLGALLRSCEAFGVSRVILTAEAAHPFLPKAVKASAGSVLRLPLQRGPALASFAKTPIVNCVALDSAGVPVDCFDWPQDMLLVVGEEGQGLGDPQAFPHTISIPTQGVESLNAVVAASIALAARAFHLRKK